MLKPPALPEDTFMCAGHVHELGGESPLPT